MTTKPVIAHTLPPAVLLAAAVFLGPMARANAGDAVDRSQYTLLSPTPDKDLRDFSPDRPTRSISPFTVDAGHFQIESDFLSYTTADQQGATTRRYQAADPVLKLGLTSAVDFEVTLGGFNDLRTADDATHQTLHPVPGVKDLTAHAEFYTQVTTERHADDRGIPNYQIYNDIAHRF